MRDLLGEYGNSWDRYRDVALLGRVDITGEDNVQNEEFCAAVRAGRAS